ncbi:MAG: hypothetical protein AAGI15_18145, partial [Pseudomonadota bacterium]
KDQPMKRTLWKTLESTSVLAAASLAAGCDNSTPADSAETAAEAKSGLAHDMAAMDPGASMAVAAEGEGGEGGEGEGEGTSDTASLLTDDAAFLAQIGLMRGHLWVGHQLYLAGEVDMAATHMKHPQAEIYSTLLDAFAARDVPGFADELTALAETVTGDAGTEAVQASYDALVGKIEMNERNGADVSSPAVAAGVIVTLLRTAGEEYAIGIVDGQVANVHEYQDALGFTQIARQWAASPAFAKPEQAVAVAAKIQDLTDRLLDQWPSLAPEGAVPFTAERIYGAAARVELDALALQRGG